MVSGDYNGRYFDGYHGFPRGGSYRNGDGEGCVFIKNIIGLKIHEYFLIGSMVTREVMVFPEDN